MDYVLQPQHVVRRLEGVPAAPRFRRGRAGGAGGSRRAHRGGHDPAAQKKRRILNADETHHTLDNEGDRGGSRARTYVGRGRSRSGQRHVKAAGHVTGLYTNTADKQNGSVMYMFSTSAEEQANYQVC